MNKENRKVKSFLIALLLAMCLMTSLFAYDARGKSPKLVTYADNGIVRLVRGDFESAAIKNGADVFYVLNKLKDTYGYENAHDELALNKTMDTAFGKVYRFSQIKNGLEVFGRGLNVSVDFAGEVLSVSGNYLKGIKINFAPKLDVENAAGIILNTYRGAQINSVDLEVYSLNDCRPALAYNIVADIDGALTRFFVSAETGGIIEEIPMDSNHMPPNYNNTIVNSTQKDYYGEDKSVDLERQRVDIYNNYYFLNDAYRNIILYDCKNTDQPQDYFVSMTPSFNDGLAVTALLNTIKAFDFYTDANNIGVSISGMDDTVDGTHTNREAFILVCLHYGQEYQNAFCSFNPDYVDDEFGRFMYLCFGDGHPSGLYNPAVALDIVGHEYQHAVTGYTAGLIYQNASGALNEAYSDIFGALIEDRPQTDDNFWICGEDATLNKQGLRSMKNPAFYGYPDHMDNMYPMDGNYDEGGVHHNSTIVTHAQYKMWEAMPSHFTKQNIGKLWYSALTMLSPDSNFFDFKIIMMQAASQLGWSGSVLEVIDQAFEDCGIRATEGAHTVAFERGDMTGTAPTIITKAYGDSFIIPECGLTASRAVLKGWSETGNYKSAIYLAGEEYPMPAYDMTLYPVLEREIWNGIEPVVLQGEGTAISPYLIPTAEALATVGYYFNNDVERPWGERTNPHFLMTKDIDLENIPWIPIGYARDGGSDEPEPEPLAERIKFDGGGHVIRNLKIYYEDPDKFEYQGFFGAIGDIDIVRLGIESGKIETASAYVGAIAGGLRDASVVDCFSRIDVVNSASIIFFDGDTTFGSAGGVVGYIYGENSSITYCGNSGFVSAYYSGGICAVQYGNVPLKGCYNSGAVSGLMMGGGIIGFSTCFDISDCINTGAVSGRSATIGGICGAMYAIDQEKLESVMTGCKNTGVIDGLFCGGLIGTAAYDCSILLEKNYYIEQSDMDYVGYVIGEIAFLGGDPVCSEDTEGQGDFAFENAEYFFNPLYFGDVSSESALRLYCLFGGFRTLTVKWQIGGETETEEYGFGEVPQYDGAPQKQSDVQFSYAFTDWSAALAESAGVIVIAAQFEQLYNNYTVTFMSNGEVFDTRIVTYGKLASLPEPVRDGYKFKGWFKDENCKNAFDKDSEMISSNMNLYAKWESNMACGCGTIDISSGMIIFFMLMLSLTLAACVLKSRRKASFCNQK